MREVAGRREGRGERVRRAGLDVVPAHVRQAARALEQRGRAGEQAEPGRLALLAAGEQQLHPDAHAEEVGAVAQGAHDRVGEPALAQRVHRVRGLPDARDDDEARARDLLGLVAHGHLGARALERRTQRAQVARAVVDERGDHSTPFVLAMPLRAASGSTASRSASATALKAASVT